MRFKPAKSRSLILKKRNVKNVKFKIGKEIIPTVTETCQMSRGVLNDSMTDVTNVIEMSRQAENG